ncbi:MAG: YhfC family intramembrane metalloprotease [Candidatus Bathyarchaeota archaeon]|nr:YhfC family intramembrane metalloprotease [Candidatus Bathyarchaeota archaeon]
MENINPLFMLQPIIVIAFSVALMVYWYKKRRFHQNVWLYSVIAYAVAIGLKYAVQLPTINLVIGAFGQHSIALGLYYGVQTMVFEVGLAFAVALYAVKRGKMDRRDAEAYGSGLAFWENVGFISVLSLVNLVAYYYVLSSPGAIADFTYNQLTAAAPSLFSSNATALGLVGIGVFERVSSMLIHVAWGYLCVMAALYHRRSLFIIALPMGLVDFFVPFAQSNVVLFEVGIFALAALSVFVAWYTTRALRGAPQTTTPPPLGQTSSLG